MANAPRRKNRPRDLSLLARSIVEDATGENFPSKEPPKKEPEEKPKNPHAQALGRLGGSKGGKASAIPASYILTCDIPKISLLYLKSKKVVGIIRKKTEMVLDNEFRYK
jgi:hypothetical protein